MPHSILEWEDVLQGDSGDIVMILTVCSLEFHGGLLALNLGDAGLLLGIVVGTGLFDAAA